MINPQEYIDENDRSPFARWFKKLNSQAALTVNTAIAKVQAGNQSNVKAVGKGVFEIRIDSGPGHRVYFGRIGKRRSYCSVAAPSRGSNQISRQRRHIGATTGAESGGIEMTLTRDFKETVQARAKTDAAFRKGLLNEGVQCLLDGELDAGRVILRDYINATIGFEELGSRTNKSPKSLMRMFGPNGNPQAKNLFDVICQIQEHEGVHLAVSADSEHLRASTDRKNFRQSGRRKRAVANSDEVLGLLYQRKGPILYGLIEFFRHHPDSSSPSASYKMSSPFVISETIGDEEFIYGSVVNLVQGIRRSIADGWALLEKLSVDFEHIHSTNPEKGLHSLVVSLPEELSTEDARTYAAFKGRVLGTLVQLSTQARNLFEIVPNVASSREISLFDYEGKPNGTISLRDLLIAFIHNRYLFLDGEHVPTYFQAIPGISPLTELSWDTNSIGLNSFRPLSNQSTKSK